MRLNDSGSQYRRLLSTKSNDPEVLDTANIGNADATPATSWDQAPDIVSPQPSRLDLTPKLTPLNGNIEEFESYFSDLNESTQSDVRVVLTPPNEPEAGQPPKNFGITDDPAHWTNPSVSPAENELRNTHRKKDLERKKRLPTIAKEKQLREREAAKGIALPGFGSFNVHPVYGNAALEAEKRFGLEAQGVSHLESEAKLTELQNLVDAGLSETEIRVKSVVRVVLTPPPKRARRAIARRYTENLENSLPILGDGFNYIDSGLKESSPRIDNGLLVEPGNLSIKEEFRYYSIPEVARRINLMLLQCCAAAPSNPEFALASAQDAWDIASAQGITYLESKSAIYIGSCFIYLKRWEQAILALAEALKYPVRLIKVAIMAPKKKKGKSRTPSPRLRDPPETPTSSNQPPVAQSSVTGPEPANPPATLASQPDQPSASSTAVSDPTPQQSEPATSVTVTTEVTIPSAPPENALATNMGPPLRPARGSRLAATPEQGRGRGARRTPARRGASTGSSSQSGTPIEPGAERREHARTISSSSQAPQTPTPRRGPVSQLPASGRPPLERALSEGLESSSERGISPSHRRNVSLGTGAIPSFMQPTTASTLRTGREPPLTTRGDQRPAASGLTIDPAAGRAAGRPATGTPTRASRLSQSSQLGPARTPRSANSAPLPPRGSTLGSAGSATSVPLPESEPGSGPPSATIAEPPTPQTSGPALDTSMSIDQSPVSPIEDTVNSLVIGAQATMPGNIPSIVAAQIVHEGHLEAPDEEDEERIPLAQDSDSSPNGSGLAPGPLSLGKGRDLPRSELRGRSEQAGGGVENTIDDLLEEMGVAPKEGEASDAKAQGEGLEGVEGDEGAEEGKDSESGPGSQSEQISDDQSLDHQEAESEFENPDKSDQESDENSDEDSDSQEEHDKEEEEEEESDENRDDEGNAPQSTSHPLFKSFPPFQESTIANYSSPNSASQAGQQPFTDQTPSYSTNVLYGAGPNAVHWTRHPLWERAQAPATMTPEQTENLIIGQVNEGEVRSRTPSEERTRRYEEHVWAAAKAAGEEDSTEEPLPEPTFFPSVPITIPGAPANGGAEEGEGIGFGVGIDLPSGLRETSHFSPQSSASSSSGERGDLVNSIPQPARPPAPEPRSPSSPSATSGLLPPSIAHSTQTQRQEEGVQTEGATRVAWAERPYTPPQWDVIPPQVYPEPEGLRTSTLFTGDFRPPGQRRSSNVPATTASAGDTFSSFIHGLRGLGGKRPQERGRGRATQRPGDEKEDDAPDLGDPFDPHSSHPPLIPPLGSLPFLPPSTNPPTLVRPTTAGEAAAFTRQRLDPPRGLPRRRTITASHYKAL
ncbi:hypothetical protein G7Y89_g14556 [Cudoniella acicularis]|uniref:Uncharacterized protein n=1 Tax=Cudoniella acicularis TaxID=354080 RepID=A0A8H4R4A9_9HELO|nr:hypothetical protein G7Y89_g14556 [Cudoniella acicularis]